MDWALYAPAAAFFSSSTEVSCPRSVSDGMQLPLPRARAIGQGGNVQEAPHATSRARVYMHLLLIDGIKDIVLHNGMIRVECLSAGPNGQQNLSGTLLIPANVA